MLVAENGYIGKDANGVQLYALSVHGHNGSGWFPVGPEDRFAALSLAVRPWVDRPDGYTLICGQRGIGSKEMASPANWHYKAANTVGGSVRVRNHPGNKHHQPVAGVMLHDDLSGAKACRIWSTAAGVAALIAGVPVQYDAPKWICQEGAGKTAPMVDDRARAKALQTMSYGQWSIDELNTGEPFERIRANIESASW